MRSPAPSGGSHDPRREALRGLRDTVRSPVPAAAPDDLHGDGPGVRVSPVPWPPARGPREARSLCVRLRINTAGAPPHPRAGGQYNSPGDEENAGEAGEG